jgi:hypothetical protein
MSLYQLANQSLDETNFRQNVSVSETIENQISTDRRRITLSQYGDIFNLKGFYFQNVSEDFKFKNVKLIVGGSVFLSLDIDILLGINPSFERRLNNNRYYKIPWEEMKWKNVIKLVGLQYHEVNLEVDYSGTSENITLVQEFLFYDGDARRNLATNQFSNKVLQMETQNFTSNQQQNYTLYFTGFSNGLIIQGINEISEIELLFNGHRRLNLTQAGLMATNSKISDKCYYISLSSDNNIFSDNFERACNLSRIDSISIKIVTPENVPFKIANVHPNIYVQYSGMAGMRYAIGNGQGFSSNPTSVSIPQVV